MIEILCWACKNKVSGIESKTTGNVYCPVCGAVIK